MGDDEEGDDDDESNLDIVDLVKLVRILTEDSGDNHYQPQPITYQQQQSIPESTYFTERRTHYKPVSYQRPQPQPINNYKPAPQPQPQPIKTYTYEPIRPKPVSYHY